MPVFVYDFIHLNLEFEDARVRLLAVKEFRTGAHPRIFLDAGALPMGREVEAEVDAPYDRDGILSVPLRWAATGPAAIFPGFDGELELSRLGDGSAQLCLMGRYQPPFGSVGQALVRAMLHGVAEDTVRDVLTSIAARLGARELIA